MPLKNISSNKPIKTTYIIKLIKLLTFTSVPINSVAFASAIITDKTKIGKHSLTDSPKLIFFSLNIYHFFLIISKTIAKTNTTKHI